MLKPKDESDLLCIKSSYDKYQRDFSKNYISECTELFSGILQKGDLLYMPRGVVHYGKTVEGKGHSTHVTLSNQ